MGGFVGLATERGADSAATLRSMLGAQALMGRPWALMGSMAVYGEKDVDLAADGADMLAICGYVRRGSEAVGARALLELWRQHGATILADLDGEHAVAANVAGTTVVARDRFGTRPLYVAERPGIGALFSTAIGPLLSAGVAADVNRDAVVRGLILGYVPAPDTALTRVAQVPAGELWTLAPRPRRTRWYAPCEHVDRRRSFSAAARALDAAVTRAVECALPASGRIGTFLSGGVDSSLVVARVHEAGRDVEAFTLHFGDHLPGELRYAQAVAAHLGIRHHVLEVDARTFVDAIETTLLHLEDSLSEPIAVPNFLLAREAARSCDVVFTGEGGDPPFGGPKNIGMVLARAYGRSPLAPSLAEAYMTAHHHLADDLDLALTREWRSSFDLPRLTQSLRDQLEPEAERESSGSKTFVGGLMRTNIAWKGASNILVKVAKMVGAHDLALRSPLFGRSVVELALTIPPWQKLWGTEEKTVLRKVALRSLPAFVVDRPKRGMAVPLRAWLDGPLGELARDTLTARAVRERGIFRWDYVERLLRLERMPTDLARSRSADKLWLVLVTELHQRTLERLAERQRAA
jgi:asparagine synthase (glutamine-hydrolysing)